MVKFKKLIWQLTVVCFSAIILCQTAFAAGRTLVPIGDVVGISIETEGVLVVGFPDESNSSAKKAGLKVGDVIVKINDTIINNGIDIGAFSFSSNPVVITVMRNGAEKQFTVTPDISGGTAELGLWLRDSLSGIGTVTFYDPETGVFGALGHSINDLDTGVLIPIGNGIITNAEISDVIHGKCGIPGQLTGTFDFSTAVGIINNNTLCGIFGTVTDTSAIEDLTVVETAEASEIHTGSAVIISCVTDSGPCEYDVEITRVDIGNRDGHSFMLKITDDELLNHTGGIVQGMGVRYNRDNTGNP